MTRPLCPYPEEAKYKGSGNTNDAASFVCATAPNRQLQHKMGGGHASRHFIRSAASP